MPGLQRDLGADVIDIADWLRVQAINEANRESPDDGRVQAFHKAADEIDRLRGVLRRYTCECLEPCFFYDAEEAKADQMPNPPCGWWAREVLG